MRSIWNELRTNYGKHLLFVLCFHSLSAFSRLLVDTNDGLAPIWLSFGFAVAFMVRFGPQYAITVLISEIIVGYSFLSFTLFYSTLIAVGSTGTVFFGYSALRYICKIERHVSRPVEVFVLVFFAAFVGSAINAVTGIISVIGMEWVPPEDAIQAFALWWTADVIGTVTLTPLLLEFLNRKKLQRAPTPAYEFPLLGLCLVAALFVTIVPIVENSAIEPALAYLLFPVTIWSAARFDLKTTYTTSAIITATIIVATINDMGPFAREDKYESLILLHSFNLALATTGMFVATNAVQKRKATLALENTNADLEERVRKRTRDLELAQQEADRANNAKSAFLATMSHEIRTPLNGVVGVAEILDQTELTTEQQEYVQMLRNSGKGLLHIVGDILDFSKIEAGKMALDPHNFSLAQLITELSDMFRIPAKEKKIDLSLTIDTGIPDQLEADSARLRQVLINLIGNAVKFTSDGRITARISGCKDEKSESSKWTLKIAVVDEGIGMTLEETERLFTPFTQVNSSMTREFGGTGLGLTISRSIAEMMGGRIWVESEKGKGSTFHVEVQVRASENQVSYLTKDVPKPKPSAEPKKEFRINGEAISVLVAEDNKVNQRIISVMLKRMGCESTIEENGALAFDSFARSLPQIVLMDIQMPVMDGFEATRRIRRHEADAKISCPSYIIAITANALERDRQLAMEVGMNDFLVKPLDFAKLGESLLRAVNELEALSES